MIIFFLNFIDQGSELKIDHRCKVILIRSKISDHMIFSKNIRAVIVLAEG